MVKRIVWKAARFPFKPFVQNPYREGTMGSIMWKAKWGKPLSEAERTDLDSARDAIGEIAEFLRPLSEQMPYWLRAPGRYEVMSGLIDSLPKPMREYLHRNTPDDAERKIEGMLCIASYQREKTSVKYARCALTISILAFLASTITLGATIFIQMGLARIHRSDGPWR